MQNMNWINDWPTFVKSVCARWDAGLSDSEATEQFAHQRVTWEGLVANTFKDGDVGMHMPRIDFRLNDGRHGYAAGLVLAIARQNALEWMQVQIGDQVRFETEIDIPIDNPFVQAGIEWSAAPMKDGRISKTEGSLSISTRDSRLVEILKTPRR